MNTVVRRILVQFAAVVTLWLAAAVLSDAFSPSLSERFYPFGNVHLMEEALEGSYSPSTDPLFLLYVMSIAVVAFGITSFVAARGSVSRHLPYYAVPSVVVIALLALLARGVWSKSYPSSLRTAFLLQLTVYGAASLIGLLLAAARNPTVRAPRG